MTKFYRSRTNAKIAGVCGGFAELYDMDPTIIRLITLAIALLTAVGPMVLVYLIAWWIVPLGADSPTGENSEAR